jgi:hypothetical protein
MLGLSCLLCSFPADAAWSQYDDIDPTSPPAGFSWSSQALYGYYYVDSSNKVQQWTVRGFEVNQNFDDNHVKTHAGNTKKHTHKQYDFGEDSTTPDANVARANKFWNFRFQKGTKCTKHTDATNKTNCHAWGFDAALDGTYNYWINSGTTANAVYSDDADTVVPRSLVEADDLVKYSDHTSLVTSASGAEPDGLKWKFNASGVYSHSADGWDTPMCGDGSNPSTGTTLADQGWSWDEDGAGDYGDPYRVN